MRRSSFILTSLLFFLCACITDDGDVYKKYFTKYFGNDGDHEAADMVINADGTIILIGTAEFPANSGNTKVYIAKTDRQGNILWEKATGTGVDFAQDIEPTSTGYIILSNIATGSGQYDFKLTRIDADGNEEDSFVFDLLADQFAQSVTPLSDDGFYVAGNTSDIDPVNTSLPSGVDNFEDLLYVRLDDDLQLLNYDRIGGSREGSAIKVFERSPGNFTACEYSDIWNNLEEIGNPQYELNFGFSNFSFSPGSVSATLYLGDNIKDEVMSQAMYAVDESFYSIGTAIGASDARSIFITKVRNGGTGPFQQFQNSFSSGMEGVSIFANGSACYVLGNAISESDGTRDIWLTRVNSITGEQDSRWSDGVTFGTATNDDTGKIVMIDPNGNIVILGTMNLTNQRKITLIKLSSDGKFVP